jgi:hypothetical protein
LCCGSVSRSGGDEDTHMDLSEASAAAKKRNEEVLKQLELKRRARTINVPTNDKVCVFW